MFRFSTFLENILPGPKRIYGIHLNYQVDGTVLCQWVLTERQKDNLKIIKSGQLDSLDELMSELDNKIPIALSVDGRGILHKMINKKNEEISVQQVLTGGKESDFYIQEYQINEELSFLSLIRIQWFSQLISNFANNQLKVIQFSSGTFTVDILSNYLEGLPNIKIENSLITIRDNRVSSIDTDNSGLPASTIELDGFETGSDIFLPFSNVLFFIHGEVHIRFIGKTPEIHRKEFEHGRMFTILAWTVMLFFFVTLTINFFVYTHLSEKVADMSIEIAQHSVVSNQMNDIKNNIKKYNYLLEFSSIGNSKFSYFSDRIVSTMPSDITLDLLNIYPVKDRIRMNQLISYQNNSILIRGTTSSSSNINIWITNLLKLNWVDRVDIGYYRLEETARRGEFELIITIIEIPR